MKVHVYAMHSHIKCVCTYKNSLQCVTPLIYFQPDSTRDRDRDLRELIGGGRKHSDDHHSQQSWGSGRRRQGEIEERELGEREAEDEGEEEEEGTATSTSIISSVVRLVERYTILCYTLY